MIQRTLLPIILTLYVLLGTLYAVRTPAWQTPDEPAHYNYIRQLAALQFPLMTAADYDEAYRNEVVSSAFHPQYNLDSISYEDYQPPLYYLVETPLFWLGGGSLTVLRLGSVLMGAGIMWLTWGIGRAVFDERWWLTATATLFVALLPQHLAILGSVNNDALAWLLIAAMLYVLVQTPADAPLPRSLTVLLGLAFLTKVTAYLMAGVIGLLLLWRYWGRWQTLVRECVRVLGPALAIGSLWWIRNIIVYPGFDFLGTVRHDSVVLGQLTTADWLGQVGVREGMLAFGRTTFRSFFGQFGWMCCPLPGWAWMPLTLMLIVAAIGMLLALRRLQPSAQQRQQLFVFSVLLGFNLLLYLVYNARFVQHQGRYLFAALIPISIGISVGLDSIARLIPERIVRWIAPATVGIGLLGLNVWTIWRILPCMSWSGC